MNLPGKFRLKWQEITKSLTEPDLEYWANDRVCGRWHLVIIPTVPDLWDFLKSAKTSPTKLL